LFVLGLVGLASAPLLAQSTETGPQGYAEPKIKQLVVHEVPPPPKPTAENTLNMQLSSGGVVSIELRPDKAPKSVERLKVLTARNFYDGTIFHRVIEGFMAQGGDPKGTGEGGSDLPDLKAEFNDLPHVRGAMAMARAESPDSANSQFYIMLSPNLTLDRQYTVVGRVYQGMHYVDGIAKGEPPEHPTKIVHAWIGAPPANPDTPPVADAPSAVPAPGTLALPTTLSPGADAGNPPTAPPAKATAPARKPAPKKKPK
jgi:cyclophilin family peptidyl-prolyl cis-trans isomerase